MNKKTKDIELLASVLKELAREGKTEVLTKDVNEWLVQWGEKPMSEQKINCLFPLAIDALS